VSVVKDVGLTLKSLIDWDSYKIVAAAFPLVVASRMADECIQYNFYDPRRHKNIRQLPGWMYKAADYAIYVPLACLGSLLFLAPTHDMRTSGRVFLTGITFVWLGKDIIKKCKIDINRRPWHERFSRYCRDYGGFPSGHMSASVYMALFWGLRYGYRFSVPLGLCSAWIGVAYLIGNRHYLSQLVGGAAWGALWAYASSKVADHNIARDYEFAMHLNAHGAPEIEFSYNF
jgi:membrane-associated phospholipid phosphatase